MRGRRGDRVAVRLKAAIKAKWTEHHKTALPTAVPQPDSTMPGHTRTHARARKAGKSKYERNSANVSIVFLQGFRCPAVLILVSKEISTPPEKQPLTKSWRTEIRGVFHKRVDVTSPASEVWRLKSSFNGAVKDLLHEMRVPG